FFSIVMLVAFVTFMISLALTQSATIGVLGAALAGAVPFVMMQAKRSKRAKAVDDQLPDALDFLTRILRAGHSLATGFQMAGEELPVRSVHNSPAAMLSTASSSRWKIR